MSPTNNKTIHEAHPLIPILTEIAKIVGAKRATTAPTGRMNRRVRLTRAIELNRIMLSFKISGKVSNR